MFEPDQIKSEQEEIMENDWESLKTGGHFHKAREIALREGKGISVFLMKDGNSSSNQEDTTNCRFMYYGAEGVGWRKTLETNPAWERANLRKFNHEKHLLICVLRSTPNGCFGIFHICNNEDFSILV